MQYWPRGWHGGLAGTVSGFASTLAHIGVPFVSVYLLLQNISPPVFVATSALFFMILNLIKVPYYFYANLFNFALFGSLGWMLPIIQFGVWVGKWITNRVHKRTFDRVILFLLLVSATLLLVR